MENFKILCFPEAQGSKYFTGNTEGRYGDKIWDINELYAEANVGTGLLQ